MRVVANWLEEDPAEFNARFWRCYRLLHFITCRVLGGPERAEEAIDNCWHTASRHAPRFEYEGAFRSWLVRVLIDEALALLPKRQQSVDSQPSCKSIPATNFRRDDIHNAKASSTENRNRFFQQFPMVME
jgi:DNA-directed RNA polymerase specialized sigma24 family protein